MSVSTVAGEASVRCAAGAVELETLAYGARVHRLWVRTPTGRRNVVLGHPTAADHRAAGDHMGATVGRYANRIAGAELPLGGRTYLLAANENGNTLHGGAEGFGDRTWRCVAASDTAVEYALTSPDGDQGFPGAVTAHARYTVRPDGVDIELTATCDAPTVVSLTNHAYFNLRGAGSGTVDSHLLTVPADTWTPIDAALVPTGEVAPVDGTPLDLRRPTLLGAAVRSRHPVLAPARGIDHNLVPVGAGLRPVASLEVDDLRLVVESDAPALQVYTGNFLDGSAAGETGPVHRQGDGLCLEPQAFPDAPHHPQFGSTELLPGEVYRRVIRWTFSQP